MSPGSAPEFNIESSANAADSPIRMASDYSYSATTYAGDRFRIVGDAGGGSLSLSLCSFLAHCD